MNTTQLKKLHRILGLLGSDQVGERAAAALAAHKLVAASGLDWSDLMCGEKAPTIRTIIRHGGEPDIDQVRAAESRMRQLRMENERLSLETKRLKTRLAEMAGQARKARMQEWDD